MIVTNDEKINDLQLFKIKEVCELLGCCRRTVERLRDDGFLICSPVMSGIRITRESVERYQEFMIRNYEEANGIIKKNFE